MQGCGGRENLPLRFIIHRVCTAEKRRLAFPQCLKIRGLSPLNFIVRKNCTIARRERIRLYVSQLSSIRGARRTAAKGEITIDR
jgi:hypothetical protein